MIAMLTGFLFFVAMTVAIATIAGMTLAYRHKAVAALCMELRPTPVHEQVFSRFYVPVRPFRAAAVRSTRITASAFRRVNAA